MLDVCPKLMKVIGLETAFSLSVFTLTLHFGLVRMKPVATGIGGGSLGLGTLEKSAACRFFALIRWRRDGRFPRVTGIVGGVMLVPWIIYSSIGLSSPIADTLTAKMA